MKVWNPTDAGVFVSGYGVLAPGQGADVRQEVGEPLTGEHGPLKVGNPPKAAQDKPADAAQPAAANSERTGDGT